MLSKGLRDEENEKVNQVFDKIMSIQFVPDLWKNEQRKAMNVHLQNLLNLTLDDIENRSVESLLNDLKTHDLEFANYELFGDLLLKLLPFEAETNQANLAQKALAVFETAQQESKIFSFSLIQKINHAKALR
ncbi:hypothetical protein L1I30_02505 [Gillisia sp. M10.2A]|uniref:Uncharacterized protein n=1 Tax=Gillisia lutea TaxID=2909668 RepID=A0ABS9EF82_9FLAO|nr:hypothetical protein [Gillisia lutea]MCF4100529.1 hypothetical protein [Gillisia lutea]